MKKQNSKQLAKKLLKESAGYSVAKLRGMFREGTVNELRNDRPINAHPDAPAPQPKRFPLSRDTKNAELSMSTSNLYADIAKTAGHIKTLSDHLERMAREGKNTEEVGQKLSKMLVLLRNKLNSQLQSSYDTKLVASRTNKGNSISESVDSGEVSKLALKYSEGEISWDEFKDCVDSLDHGDYSDEKDGWEDNDDLDSEFDHEGIYDEDSDLDEADETATVQSKDDKTFTVKRADGTTTQLNKDSVTTGPNGKLIAKKPDAMPGQEITFTDDENKIGESAELTAMLRIAGLR